MKFYIARRICVLVSTWLVISAICFQLVSNSPQFCPQEHDYISAWIKYIYQICSQTFGINENGDNIVGTIFEIIPASLELLVLAIIGSLILGLPLGLGAGMNPNSLYTKFIKAFCSISHAVPIFGLALLLSLFFSNFTGWYPASGEYNLLFEPQRYTGFTLIDVTFFPQENSIELLKNVLQHLLLPVVSLLVLPTVEVINAVANNVIDIKKHNYIKAAASQGQSPLEITYHHILPNLLPNLIAFLGMQTATLMSLLVIIEYIFDWPGIGRWLLLAVNDHDFYAISAGILIISSCILLLNILADIVAIIFDPLTRNEWNAIN